MAGNEMPGIHPISSSMPPGRVGDDRKTAMWQSLYIIIGVRVNEVKVAGGDVGYVLVPQWQ